MMFRPKWAGSCLALIMSLGGCKTSGDAAGVKDSVDAANSASSETSRRRAEVLRFRNLFHKLGVNQGMSDQAIQKLVLMPSETFITPPPAAIAATDLDVANAAIAAQTKAPGETPSAFYQNSVATPYDDSIDIDQVFAKNGPAPLIFIPGILGEFIDKNVIHEVFTGPSAFKDVYQDQLNQIQDHAYSLAALDQVDFALGERVHLGGIDGADHKPHVQAMFLQAGTGSLETLGDNATNAATFLRRINKAFSKIPLDQCKNIYLVGYSQGADVAMDMITQAHATPEEYPFLQNVKGVVTLAGVIYGTETADDVYFNPASPNYQLAEQIKTALDHLSVPTAGDGFILASGKVVKNWAELVKAVSQVSLPATEKDPGLVKEKLNGATPDPTGFLGLFSHNLSDLFRPGLSPTQALANIERGRVLFEAVLTGSKALSSHARKEWWANHQWPATLPIYSVAATMADPSTATTTSVLLDSPAYGIDTVDYQLVLRPAYYGLYKITQATLNDSQVLTQREMIFSELITKWNASQPIFPTHFLGIVGTHHWGLAFPNAVPTSGGFFNLFPRRVFAEAIGAFLLDPKG